jgi:hypothetical protein
VFLDVDPNGWDLPAPEGAPLATCATCHHTIYHRDDGVWTLGRAPWWCYPDPDLVGVLAQIHEPELRRWSVTITAATREEAERLAGQAGGVLEPAAASADPDDDG